MNILMTKIPVADFLSDMIYQGLNDINQSVTRIEKLTPKIESKMKGNEYDLVIIGSLRHLFPEAVELYDKIRSIYTGKLCILDGEDDEWLYTQYSKDILYFKREYMNGLISIPNILPLNFAYMGSTSTYSSKEISVYFRGNTHYGQRGEMNSLSNIDLSLISGEKVSNKQYMSEMRKSQICLNFKGGGWDCYRYWEILLNGSLLVTETLPIEIVNRPKNGEHIIEVSRMNMFNTVASILEDPKKVFNMTTAAHKFALANHLPKHRAQYLIDEVNKWGENEDSSSSK